MKSGAPSQTSKKSKYSNLPKLGKVVFVSENDNEKTGEDEGTS